MLRPIRREQFSERFAARRKNPLPLHDRHVIFPILGKHCKCNMCSLLCALFCVGIIFVYIRIIVANNQERYAREYLRTPAYDVVVVGAGPAGLTAALFAARAGLSVLVTGSTVTQLSEAATFANYPSFAGSGQDWLDSTAQQAAALGVYFAQAGLLVRTIQRNGYLFEIHLDNQVSFLGLTVILASGAESRRLELPHEKELWSTSIHSCAICDGALYAGKTVVVVGGGDAAVDAALLLSRHARSILLVHRTTHFRASNRSNLKRLRELPNVKIKTPFSVISYDVYPETQLNGVTIKNADGVTESVPCDGVFLAIGSTPNTAFLKGVVSLNNRGLVEVKEGSTATHVSGIFAAGEIIENSYRQAITAASSGAKAAIDAERWLQVQPYGIPSRSLPAGIPLEQIEIKQPSPRLVATANSLPPPNAAVVSPSEECDLAHKECITRLIQRYRVVIFSKSYCPYCKKALQILALEGVTEGTHVQVIELTSRDDGGKAVQAILEQMTGRRTVPNVFIGGQSVGGGDEVVALHKNGELKTLLSTAGAL